MNDLGKGFSGSTPRRNPELESLKPVLNWANVCSPEHTSIWFGQSKLYFILNWLVMRCKLRPELAAEAQQTA